MNTIRLINRVLFFIGLLGIFIIDETSRGTDYLLGLVSLILFISLFPIVIVELYFLLFKKQSYLVLAILFPFVGYLTFLGWMFLGSWSADIEKILIFPEGYDKEYAIVVYGVESGVSIEPTYSKKRIRKINFPKNGVFLTSTISESTMDAIDYPTPKVFIGDKRLNPSTYIGNENTHPQYSKGFWISNSKEKGFFFKFINLNHSELNIDSVLKADEINFRDFYSSSSSNEATVEME